MTESVPEQLRKIAAREEALGRGGDWVRNVAHHIDCLNAELTGAKMALADTGKENTRLRAELAEWREAMPECGNGDHDCTEKATHVGGPDDSYFSCDAHLSRWTPSVGGWRPLPWAALVRKAAE
jgi:hypothetical protein